MNLNELIDELCLLVRHKLNHQNIALIRKLQPALPRVLGEAGPIGGLYAAGEKRRRAFTSVLRSSKAKGTGLGLAIVGRIIETHRGQVKIKSLPGKGTTVSVFLPF